MLDFRRLDRHHDAGGDPVGLVAPVVLPENAKRLSDGFEQALRSDFGGMLHAFGVPAGDTACSNGHRRKIALSVFLR